MADILERPLASLPLVGQSFSLKAIIPTVMIACGCPATTAMLMVGLGSETRCPACARSFRLNGVIVDGKTGEHGASIGTLPGGLVQ